MDFIQKKIDIITDKLQKLSQISSEQIPYKFIPCPEYKKNNTPPSPDAPWETPEMHQRFYGVDSHYWIHFTIAPIEKREGMEPRLSVRTGREGGWDADNPQLIVYANGKNIQGMDINHTWLPLEFEKEYDIYVYLYNGMIDGDYCFEPSVCITDLRTESLCYDIRVPYECMLLLEEGSADYCTIREHLDKATLLLDLRDFYSEDYYNSIEKAAEYMKCEFYGKACGNTKGVVSCIGHTHIDVAWLWTVAQTREKAQRSFSTVLNMMRHYDNYMFMSSQPQLYQYVKEEDPELYEEIKKHVKEGRWEAEGGMWLESDTNLVSGESLIRQILYGKRFMKKEFGVDNKMLWLPDVFGYSAALPQIMRKCGLTQFFTTKLYWNETNRVPDDTFEWEGLDGSRVFATFIPRYVLDLTPFEIKKMWDVFQNKEITDETLFTFGWGDGGGGPTYKMMENFNRMEYGIPGMPKLVMKTAGEHIDKIEKDFYANTTAEYSRPRWVGEIYFESHRGTYTSVAKNKKNNRKSELLYQTTETAAVTDMLLAGGKYPQDILEKHQTTILLNQFHDIIPGSSIGPVYDVTDVEYAQIIKDGTELKCSSLENIKSNINTDGGIFVYNPTPFAADDYIELDGKTYYAEDIPAHGWKVIENTPVKMAVTVTENKLENDVLRVEFNEKYEITSIFDKTAEREVLAEGALGNRLEVFEDYAGEYDAWDLHNFYKQKMWVADDVSDVKFIEGGIEVTRKYRKSEIVQKILLKPGSKRIDFVTKVDWQEDHVLLKAAFPVDIHNNTATYDIQFGSIERPTHLNTSWDSVKFEVSAHKWADLSEEGYGVSILNDCKYGYNIEGNTMKITLLKAATFPDPIADRGIHEFTYSLYPHEGSFKSGKTIENGYLLNMPLEASSIPETKGNIPDCYGLIATDKANVVIETVKKAEEDDSVIVRMYESYNSKTKAAITTGFDFKEVYLCDMLENNEKALDFEGRVVKIDIKNFEIVTLKFVV